MPVTMPKNVVTPLNFTKRLTAYCLTNIQNHSITKRTIVVNLGQGEIIVKTPPPVKLLLPRSSSIYKDVAIISGDSAVCIELPDDLTNIGGVILDDGWFQLSKEAPVYPEDIPLYKSPQFTIGKVRYDPFYATGQTLLPEETKMAEFEVKVNIWFCPARTNCGIHNRHTDPEMLEVHTQIYGKGRMQKFRENDLNTLYEDIIMDPGMTHAPFTGVMQDGGLFYGWHQYYGETDCIWMAIEFHPISKPQ